MKKDGFIIYPGKLTSADTFRIGCIGQVDSYVMEKVAMSVESSLKKMGVKIIDKKDRNYAGPTAPSRGLTLMGIDY